MHDASRMFPILVIAAVLGSVGVVVLLLRRRLAPLYDRFDMPEEDRERYKRVVLPLMGWLLIGSAIFLGAVSIYGLAAPDRLRYFMQTVESGAWLQRGFGVLMIVLGALNAASHLTGKPRPLKLAAMTQRYGSVAGRAVHLFAYTLVPIVFGALLLVVF